MRQSLLLLATSLVAVIGAPKIARACSYAEPGLGPFRSPLPADGSTNQPRNARIWVGYPLFTYPGGPVPPPLGQDLALRAKGGAPVSTTFRLVNGDALGFTYVVMTPAQSLLANTTYELVDKRTLPCEVARGSCALGTPAAFSSFTTGDFLDSKPPTFAGVASVEAQPFQTCAGSACCGPFVIRTYDMRWTAARDEGSASWVRYNVYRRVDGANVHVTVTDHAQFGAWVSCEGRGNGAVSEGEYLVRAEDWAGNEDDNTVVQTITKACENAPPAVPVVLPGSGGASGTGGTGGTGGAEQSGGSSGAGDVAAETSSGPGDGSIHGEKSAPPSCSISGGTRMGTAFAACLVAFLLAAVRRASRS
jgi:hypothetical protein